MLIATIEASILNKSMSRSGSEGYGSEWARVGNELDFIFWSDNLEV
jgi:hypothetical protein